MPNRLNDPSHGFVRICAATPELRIADVAFNAAATLALLQRAATAGAQLVVFPELGLTSYSCGDLFHSSLLLDRAREALAKLASDARELPPFLVGLPFEHHGRVHNCAAFCAGGRVVGLVPKTHLPNYGEFYEKRWFAAAADLQPGFARVGDADAPIGTDLLFAATNQRALVIGVELCEDLWAVEPPGGRLALAGATLIANLSASNELLGKAAYRRDLVRQQSARALCAYVYSSCGPWESSTDIVFSGHCMISECGRVLAESERFSFDGTLTLADVDLHLLRHERLHSTTFAADASSRARHASALREMPFLLPHAPKYEDRSVDLLRPLARHPFVPADSGERAAHCEEVFSIQAAGLARRLGHTGSSTIVLGLSGGLDSTLALLVACRATQLAGRDPGMILTVTMPGYGTTERTRGNATELAACLGVHLREIPIHDAVATHFRDIGHDPAVHDVTYENAQARERTQVLMDLANKTGGLVLGTGDLSEAALGWCTFNGDHMSMYHVNIGVPKTLVRYLIEWCASHVFEGRTAEVLRDILATPITPELLPLKEGELQQRTEEVVGPYELHDFFLYHHVRRQCTPARIQLLATRAFAPDYSPEVIAKWLQVFLKRFITQQFKRNSMPDGPKVGSVALSPRGDWRMPSDVSPNLWVART